MRLSAIPILTSLVIAATASVPGIAQTRDATVYTKTDTRDLVQRLERYSDDFRKHFDKALDRSSLDGTDREDRLRRWTDDLRNMTDHFKDDYNHGRIHNMEERVNTLLAIAAGINRVLLYRPFDAATDRDWNLLRSDLNALALMYNLPSLQSYRPPNNVSQASR